MIKVIDYEKNRQELDQIMQKRRQFTVDDEINKIVREIINEVQNNGDQAVKKYTSRFDKVDLDQLRVTEAEIEKACTKIEQSYLDSLRKAIDNVREFHKKQLRENWFSYREDTMVGQLINPLKRVGAYVPGGLAAYPSSVVMTVIPGKAAGVEEIVITTPPGKNGQVNPYILAAARETGADEIYKIGGAQAIAALALGTESISPVDKIVGPGNIFVTIAKKMVFGQVDIDMLAGPSEVMILADENANADYIAADLLSQAEHDSRAASVLVTTSKKIADKTIKSLKKQLSELPKKEIAVSALDNYGLIVLVDELKTGIDLVNRFAPEHFELVVKNPFNYLNLIKNAGAIFIGENTSEPVGDYFAGPNHVLPTGGTARFASPLNTDDFLKKSSIIYCQEKGLQNMAKDVIRLAKLEGLDGHARAVQIRNKKD